MKREYSITERPIVWNTLPKEIKFKIFACADVENKKMLRLTCLEMYFLNIKDVLPYSPLVLSRRDLFYHMVHIARENNSDTFKNLVHNAINCENTDVFNMVSYFLPKNSEELKLVQMYCNHQDAVTVERLLPCIMTVFKGEKQIIEQYKIKNAKNPFYNPRESEKSTALEIALQYDHPISVSELLLILDPTLLNNRGCSGNSCLLIATITKKEEMCKFLLSFKDIKIQKLITIPYEEPKEGFIPCVY